MKPFYLQDTLPFVFWTPNSCFRYLQHIVKQPQEMTPQMSVN